MKTLTLLFLTLILFFTTSLSAQHLQLTRGQQIKNLKTGSYLQVELKGNPSTPCETCGDRFVIGQLINYENGLITLNVIRESQRIRKNDKIIGYSARRYSKSTYGPEMQIPVQDVLSIMRKGRQSYKPIGFGQTLGVSLFIVGGISTISFATELKDYEYYGISSPSNGNELASGITLMTLGTGIGLISHQAKFIISPESNLTNRKNIQTWQFN